MAQMTAKEMEAEIARLTAVNQNLEKSQALKLSFGNKQNVKVSGHQNFPTTLYKDQWRRILAFGPQILAFIEDNEEKLLNKAEAQAKYGKN